MRLHNKMSSNSNLHIVFLESFILSSNTKSPKAYLRFVSTVKIGRKFLKNAFLVDKRVRKVLTWF